MIVGGKVSVVESGVDARASDTRASGGDRMVLSYINCFD